MPRKITTAEFISKSKSIHGSKYIYDKSNYKGAKESIIIICPLHGEFSQRARHHMDGFGCSECSGNKKHTKQSFIDKCHEVHGGIYDYSKLVYSSLKSQVVITCNEHGDFYQNASSHMSGRGCPECGERKRRLSRRIGKDEFVLRSIGTHGERYDYSEVEYVTAFDKVAIKCNKHGIFMQTPHNHENGKGCPGCGAEENARNRIKKASDGFVERARSVHGNKYEYSKSVYKGNLTRLTITCREHGDFQQKPSEHLSGCGCSACANYGFNTGRDGYVYFLISEKGIKVGITNKPSQRLKQLKSATPFDFNLIAKVKTTGAEAMRKEKYYHRKYESAGLTGFDGATEWLRYSPELMNEIMNENPAL